jgi:hypothetical protein
VKLLFIVRKKYAAEVLQWTIDIGQTIVGVVTDDYISNSASARKPHELNIPVITIEQAEIFIVDNQNYVDLIIYLICTGKK